MKWISRLITTDVLLVKDFSRTFAAGLYRHLQMACVEASYRCHLLQCSSLADVKSSIHYLDETTCLVIHAMTLHLIDKGTLDFLQFSFSQISMEIFVRSKMRREIFVLFFENWTLSVWIYFAISLESIIEQNGDEICREIWKTKIKQMNVSV